MGFHKPPKTGGICLRIIIFASLMAIVIYGAITPHQMHKVTAECVTIGVAGLAMAVQAYVVVARFCPLPYHVWAVVGLDGLCAAGWVAAIAVMSYWDRDVVYKPRDGDPIAWFECASAKGMVQVMTDEGVGSWINLQWCEVEVDGRHRLIGNTAARQQLHVLIGLSAATLLLTAFAIMWTIHRGKELGLIQPRSYAPAAQAVPRQRGDGGLRQKQEKEKEMEKEKENEANMC